MTDTTTALKALMDFDDRIDHLPQRKRRELRRAVQIIFEEFEESLKTKLSDKARRGRILKIILYGSHARGGWVVDHGTGYMSDFDLLIVVNHESFAENYDAWYHVDERFLQDHHFSNPNSTPVQIIVHSFENINEQRSSGRPFFVDIDRDGIPLYETEGYPLGPIGPLSDHDRHTEAQRYFQQMMENADRRFDIAGYSINKNYQKEAAFELHQTAENLYHCLMLVLTLYTPKLHDMRKLRQRAESLELRMVPVWPRDNRFSRRCFELLRRAYIEARYSPHYVINKEELDFLVERIGLLRDTVERICLERLNNGAHT